MLLRQGKVGEGRDLVFEAICVFRDGVEIAAHTVHILQHICVAFVWGGVVGSTLFSISTSHVFASIEQL
jgi:hypothetical protein